MWHTMKGSLPIAAESRPMQRGNMLENAILDWWLVDYPEHGEIERQKWCPLDDWGGATPDMVVRNPEGGIELVDAKTTSGDDDWREDVPPYYLASSLWQLACHPEAERVHLAVLFGRPFDLRTYTVERDQPLIEAIFYRCREFYDSLAHETPPPLDDTTATYEAVRALHPDIDRDLSVEIDRRTAHEYVAASLALKEAEKRERAAKARLLDVMGRARLSTCDGATVARRQPRGEAVSLVRVAQHIDPPTEEKIA
jgi:predicted phage-related endonuclease